MNQDLGNVLSPKIFQSLNKCKRYEPDLGSVISPKIFQSLNKCI